MIFGLFATPYFEIYHVRLEMSTPASVMQPVIRATMISFMILYLCVIRHIRFRHLRFRDLGPTVCCVVDAQIDLFAVGCAISQHHSVCGGQLNQLDAFSCHSVNVHPFPVAMAFSASVSSDTPGLPVSVIALAEVIVGRLLKNETIAA